MTRFHDCDEFQPAACLILFLSDGRIDNRLGCCEEMNSMIMHCGDDVGKQHDLGFFLQHYSSLQL